MDRYVSWSVITPENLAVWFAGWERILGSDQMMRSKNVIEWWDRMMRSNVKIKWWDWMMGTNDGIEWWDRMIGSNDGIRLLDRMMGSHLETRKCLK